jgi:Protein of unknown function (DUF616)
MRYSLRSIRQHQGNPKARSVRPIIQRGLRHLRETGDRITGGGLRSLAKRQMRRLRDAGDRLTRGSLRALRKRIPTASLRRAMRQPVLKELGYRVLKPSPRLAQPLYRLATALDTAPTTSDIANPVSPSSAQVKDSLLVQSLYKAAFGRLADPEGLATRLQVQGGITLQALAEELVASTQFQARHGMSQEVVASAKARQSPSIEDSERAIGQSLRASTKRSNRRVVYTCLFGHSELFLDLKIDRDEMTDFVCFTDDDSLRSDFWTIVQAPKSLLDPHRRSKGFKHRPHLLFPDHEQSLYVDNTVKLVKPPNAFFKLLDQSDAPLWMFVHPDRHCIYDEAEAVREAHLDDPALVDMQMTHYRNLGYPKNNGLNATTVMVRRHHDRNLITAMNDWHDQVLRFSKRDQLSFNVIRHFHQLAIKEFDGRLTENELIEWPVIPEGKRLPRDFDDAEYLFLHSDVAAAGVNPRKHYLDYGIIEGRPYRMSQVATPNYEDWPAPHVKHSKFTDWIEKYHSDFVLI